MFVANLGLRLPLVTRSIDAFPQILSGGGRFCFTGALMPGTTA